MYLSSYCQRKWSFMLLLQIKGKKLSLGPPKLFSNKHLNGLLDKWMMAFLKLSCIFLGPGELVILPLYPLLPHGSHHFLIMEFLYHWGKRKPQNPCQPHSLSCHSQLVRVNLCYKSSLLPLNQMLIEHLPRTQLMLGQARLTQRIQVTRREAVAKNVK